MRSTPPYGKSWIRHCTGWGGGIDTLAYDLTRLLLLATEMFNDFQISFFLRDINWKEFVHRHRYSSNICFFGTRTCECVFSSRCTLICNHPHVPYPKLVTRTTLYTTHQEVLSHSLFLWYHGAFCVQCNKSKPVLLICISFSQAHRHLYCVVSVFLFN